MPAGEFSEENVITLITLITPNLIARIMFDLLAQRNLGIHYPALNRLRFKRRVLLLGIPVQNES